MPTDNKNSKIEIAFRPKLDIEEKIILETVFGKEHLVLGEYITKGISGGVLDIQLIIFWGKELAAAVVAGKNKINSWEYLKDVLQRIQSHPASRLHELMPDRWQQLQIVVS
jgi:hypothetical protein